MGGEGEGGGERGVRVRATQCEFSRKEFVEGMSTLG